MKISKFSYFSDWFNLSDPSKVEAITTLFVSTLRNALNETMYYIISMSNYINNDPFLLNFLFSFNKISWK